MPKKSQSWYSVKALAGGSQGQGKIYNVEIFDEIGGWGISAKDLITEISGATEQDTIQLNVHSPGGSVIEGLAICNHLRQSPAKKIGNVVGIAASMAAVVVSACDELRMARDSYLMLHKVWTVAIGNDKELRSRADLLSKLESTIVNILADKTGKSLEEIELLLDPELWLTAQEAVDLGFCDKIVETNSLPAAACLSKLPIASAKIPTQAVEMYYLRNEDKDLRWPLIKRVFGVDDSFKEEIADLKASLVDATKERSERDGALLSAQAELTK